MRVRSHRNSATRRVPPKKLESQSIQDVKENYKGFGVKKVEEKREKVLHGVHNNYDTNKKPNTPVSGRKEAVLNLKNTKGGRVKLN